MMTRTFILGLACAVGLSACARVSESRFNPFNWFGQSEETAAPAAPIEDADPRPVIAQITALSVEPTPTGAIVRATGLPPTQGWYGGALVMQSDGPVNGEVVYIFRAEPPLDPARVSTPQSRALTVADRLTAQELARTRTIRVIGAQNARTVSR